MQIASPSDAQHDLFAEPDDFESLLTEAERATFQIYCESWIGSGWGISLDDADYIVTAFHVIEECLDGEPIKARNSVNGRFELTLVSYDGSYWNDSDIGFRDLALLSSSKDIETLELQPSREKLGQWVLGLGHPGTSADEYFLSPVSGRVTGFSGYEIIVTDAAINGGHSGGPLLNSNGQVMGTIFASEDSSKFENLAYAESLLLHCQVIFACDTDAPTMSLPQQVLKMK